MNRKKLFIYSIFIPVIIGAAWNIVPRVIVDEPSFFSRTESHQILESNQHGYSFLVPDHSSVVINAYPNPDKLTVSEWADQRFSASTKEEVVVGGQVFYRVNSAEGMYVLNNGVNILELQPGDVSTMELNDLLQSRTVVSRTVPVEFNQDSFADPFNDMVYSNATPGGEVPITGDDALDAIVREIGEKRGYQVRMLVDNVDELVLADGYLVRSDLRDAWQELQAEALAAGFDLSVVSGYRGPVSQTEIFISEYSNISYGLNGYYLSAADIDSEAGRQAVNETLKTVAVPGYSKHHTGWTVDIKQIGYSTFDFGETPAYGWLSANNFENARRFGFLPSYAENGPGQGPEPEAWEYVYVGADFLGF